MVLKPTTKPCLYSIDYPVPSIDFDQITWHRLDADRSGFRYRSIGSTENPQILAVVEGVKAEQHRLLETLWTDDYFRLHIWAGTTLDELKQGTRPFAELCRDDAGFYTSIHVDHRRAVAVGMLYLDDSGQYTTFYDSEQGHKPLAVADNGWYGANTHLSWHKGNSLRLRYTLKFGLYLTLG